MRLINVDSLETEEFFGREIPAYAILSHCWGPHEATWHGWVSQRCLPASDGNQGYRKVVEACGQARADKIKYLWCDTVCIDKQSSAELSEAINSMWAWYRDSKICYAYLSDVSIASPPQQHQEQNSSKRRAESRAESTAATSKAGNLLSGSVLAAFQGSRWFTRGWTLQELIAPSSVRFYSREWEQLGNKTELTGHISKTTGIPDSVLRSLSAVGKATVAQRMSWASQRETTRPEDIAYCLMGLFDINMPLLYGEGNKAFQRLQRELIGKTNDQSILAWTPTDINASLRLPVLAPSPACFRSCGSVELDDSVDTRNCMLSTSNTGLLLDGSLMATAIGDLWLIQLQCVVSTEFGYPGTKRMDLICIVVQSFTANGRYNFVRIGFPAPTAFCRLPYRAKNDISNTSNLKSWQLFARTKIMSRITLVWGNEVQDTSAPRMFPLWLHGRGEAFLPIVGPGLISHKQELSSCPCGWLDMRLRPTGWHRLCNRQSGMSLACGQSIYELVFMYPTRDMRPRAAYVGTQLLPLMTFSSFDQRENRSHGLIVFRHTRGGRCRLIGFLVSVERDYTGRIYYMTVDSVLGLQPNDLPENEAQKRRLVEAIAEHYEPQRGSQAAARSFTKSFRLASSQSDVVLRSQHSEARSDPEFKDIFTKKLPILFSARVNASAGSSTLPRLCSADQEVQYDLIPLMFFSYIDGDHDTYFEQGLRVWVVHNKDGLKALFAIVANLLILAGLIFCLARPDLVLKFLGY